MLKYLAASFSFLVVWAQVAQGEVLEFNNGDRLTGSVVSDADGKIVFKTDILGEITVPATEAKIVTEQEPVDVPVVNTAAGPAPSPAEATEEEKEENAEEQAAFNKSLDEAKAFIQSYIPAGWSGKINFGLALADTKTTSEAWSATFAAKKDSGRNHYSLAAFYYFTSQTDANGVQSKTLDKWGGGFTYAYDLSERWYLQSETDYLRDLVKDIDHQATETLSLGYKVFDTDDLKLNLLPGAAGQYIEAQGFNERWIFYVVGGEELKYYFNETFRLEQDAQIRLDPTDTSNYQFAFNGAFVANLNEWIEASLNYQYTYDTTVGPGAVKSEQIITFALGVPF